MTVRDLIRALALHRMEDEVKIDLATDPKGKDTVVADIATMAMEEDCVVLRSKEIMYSRKGRLKMRSEK